MKKKMKETFEIYETFINNRNNNNNDVNTDNNNNKTKWQIIFDKKRHC